MYIFKNAWISITRNKGRNILIGIIILVIACAATITLAINNTASDLISAYEDGYAKELTLTFDRAAMRQEMDFSQKADRETMQANFDKISSYSLDDVRKFAENEHIEDYFYTYTISLNGQNLKKAEGETSNENNSMGMGGKQKPEQANSLDFTLTGYSSLASMQDFVDGTYTITEISDDAWEKLFDGNYALINSELASYNNLELGSKFKLKDEQNNTYEFTVVGIFEDNETAEAMPMDIFSNSANNILTNAGALEQITSKNSKISAQVSPTFIIDSYDNAEAIQEAFYDQGLDEFFIVSTNQDLAESGVSSIRSVKTFATTFLIITLAIGSIVLLVINLINIRERKYEIGVLRTIGMSKPKLTSQFVVELTMVALVALLVGAGVGAILSKNVSNSLLAQEIASSSAQSEKVQENFGKPGGDKTMAEGSQNRPDNFAKSNLRTGAPVVQAYDSINAVVNLKVILELLGIGLILVFISSLAAMISIQNFSPLDILKGRS